MKRHGVALVMPATADGSCVAARRGGVGRTPSSMGRSGCVCNAVQAYCNRNFLHIYIDIGGVQNFSSGGGAGTPKTSPASASCCSLLCSHSRCVLPSWCCPAAHPRRARHPHTRNGANAVAGGHTITNNNQYNILSASSHYHRVPPYTNTYRRDIRERTSQSPTM